MTAGAFAELVGARPIGSGRWRARCPAHNDESPSLYISVGREGRVLVHCFAGCTLAQLLAVLGLAQHELFAGPPQLAEETRRIAAERAKRDEAALARRRERGRMQDDYRKLSRVADALGAKLARMADDAAGGDEITRLFHETQDRLRGIETELSEPEE